VSQLRFIREGEDVPADDYYYELVNHVTVNENGEVTSSTFELRTDCQ
jgi:hypothetical protein